MDWEGEAWTTRVSRSATENVSWDTTLKEKDFYNLKNWKILIKPRGDPGFSDECTNLFSAENRMKMKEFEPGTPLGPPMAPAV